MCTAAIAAAFSAAFCAWAWALACSRAWAAADSALAQSKLDAAAWRKSATVAPKAAPVKRSFGKLGDAEKEIARLEKVVEGNEEAVEKLVFKGTKIQEELNLKLKAANRGGVGGGGALAMAIVGAFGGFVGGGGDLSSLH